MNQVLEFRRRELIERYVTRDSENDLLNNLLEKGNIGLGPNIHAPDIGNNDVIFTFQSSIDNSNFTHKDKLIFRVI